ncbi:MAG: glycosyltransferase family 4 protein [Chloroflexota bacterium]
MSKRILFISRCPPYPLHYGDRLILWHLARVLHERGYTLDLLALTQQASDQSEITHYQQFFNNVRLFPEVQRTHWMYLQRLVGNHYPKQASSAWQSDLWQVIVTQLSNQTYDVVHLFGGVHVYEFAHLLQDYPTVITPYESYSLYLKRALAQSFTPQTWFNRQLTRQFERWMFSPYQRTVVLSNDDKTELLSINPKLAIDVIPNGVNLEDFSPRATLRDDATILFVGNFDYPPNHDAGMLLTTEIFPQIQSAIPHAKLQLVGNAPSDVMLALVSDNIIVTGRVPSVQDYLASATIFVCPLRVGAGIKNKVLEALAMGIPTVATPLSMEGIDAKDGQYVLVADIEQMASVAINLIQDKPLQQTLSHHAPQLIAERYSWKSVVTQYENLYNAVVKT